MRIATWNVNGVRSREEQLLAWLESARPDVVCLQEIKAVEEQVPERLRRLRGYWSRWHGSKGYSGVALLLRKDRFAEEPRFAPPAFDTETRALEARAGPLTFISVYVPNGGKALPPKLEFLEALDADVARRRAAGEEVVVGGDINVTRSDMDLHPKERVPGCIGQREDERALVERILSRGLVDVCRARHPDDAGMFSWWAPWRNMRQRNIGWRIDYLLASQGLAARAMDAGVEAAVGTSDHAPVFLVLEEGGIVPERRELAPEPEEPPPPPGPPPKKAKRRGAWAEPPEGSPGPLFEMPPG